MAGIRRRRRADGSTAYRVHWRLGGARTGEEVGQTFHDMKDAKKFKGLVEASEHQWPEGWVPGLGFVQVVRPPGGMTFREWALDYVENKGKIGSDTRVDYRRMVENHMLPFFGELDITDPELITTTLVNKWIRKLEKGRSPKTVRNIAGLMYSIMQAAVEHEPSYRSTNPCAKAELPKADDIGHESDDWEPDDDTEMVFLSKAEFALLRAQFTHPGARDLVTFFVLTGLRWGEATALQVREVDLDAPVPTLRVVKAWKHDKRSPEEKAAHKRNAAAGMRRRMGRPKSKKSIRTITLSQTLVALLRPYVEGKAVDAFVFEHHDLRPYHVTTTARDLRELDRLTAETDPNAMWTIAEAVEVLRPKVSRRTVARVVAGAKLKSTGTVHRAAGGRPAPQYAAQQVLKAFRKWLDVQLADQAARSGAAWKYSTFRSRHWEPALRSALRCARHADTVGGRPRSCGCAEVLQKVPRIHDLRHTHVSWLISANVPMKAISERLGHESIKTTADRYGHLEAEVDQRTNAAVDAAVAAIGFDDGGHGGDGQDDAIILPFVVPDSDEDPSATQMG